jgi:hypothetical protein
LLLIGMNAGTMHLILPLILATSHAGLAEPASQPDPAVVAAAHAVLMVTL